MAFDPAIHAAANRQNLKGLPTANAPKWTGSLGASYEADLIGDYAGGPASARTRVGRIGAARGIPAVGQVLADQ